MPGGGGQRRSGHRRGEPQPGMGKRHRLSSWGPPPSRSRSWRWDEAQSFQESGYFQPGSWTAFPPAAARSRVEVDPCACKDACACVDGGGASRVLGNPGAGFSQTPQSTCIHWRLGKQTRIPSGHCLPGTSRGSGVRGRVGGASGGRPARPMPAEIRHRSVLPYAPGALCTPLGRSPSIAK